MGFKEEKTAAELLMGARTLPGEATDFNIPTLFNPTPAFDPYVSSKQSRDLEKDFERPGIKVNLECKTRTFVLWRPYEHCTRCQSALTSGELTLPPDGDITCPHVQEMEYREVINNILGGNALKQFEEFFMLKNGIRGVQLVWLEPDKNSLAQMKAEREKKRDPIWPPNPDEIFAQPLPEEKPSDKKPEEPPTGDSSAEVH